jgi:hypothetical protein
MIPKSGTRFSDKIMRQYINARPDARAFASAINYDA